MLETKLFAKPPKVYSLSTVPLFQKYTGVFGGVFTRFGLWLKILLKGLPFTSQLGTTPVFISGAEQYIRGLSAMKQHWSQMVWFRWLNVFFSRYMWVNEWREVDIFQAAKARI
jgi:N-acetylglucosaminylphosphatidylinositol deacetylase